MHALKSEKALISHLCLTFMFPQTGRKGYSRVLYCLAGRRARWKVLCCLLRTLAIFPIPVLRMLTTRQKIGRFFPKESRQLKIKDLTILVSETAPRKQQSDYCAIKITVHKPQLQAQRCYSAFYCSTLET